MDALDTWVSQEFENLAQVIFEYDEYLRLEMVPVADQQNLLDKTKCFRIVDTRNNKVVMHAKSTATPADILADLWSMDSKHGNVLRRLDAHNAAVEALKLSKELDEKAARIDFNAFVFKNTKSRWYHEGRVRDDEFRDLGPVRKAVG